MPLMDSLLGARLMASDKESTLFFCASPYQSRPDCQSIPDSGKVIGGANAEIDGSEHGKN